ncbi:hypothetical protein BDB00DRAFT_832321 [Zychaea mexicana]|uniref:uncharacterized protein n=1 Tax=Zychaea mexicana TaxID=64656 RepID=UPI0022FDC457|nr:uncharacterized protein BDB00DRAFT_832321 [Zychaea mexicana]KAI9491466.1 hypothetical protein BDB00DRAFT_832321 [Zychaea mexicana]
MEEIEHVYEPLTEEHLNMTVEEYINVLVHKEIEKIQSNGDALIEQLESTVDGIRQKLTCTSSSSSNKDKGL